MNSVLYLRSHCYLKASIRSIKPTFTRMDFCHGTVVEEFNALISSTMKHTRKQKTYEKSINTFKFISKYRFKSFNLHLLFLLILYKETQTKRNPINILRSIYQNYRSIGIQLLSHGFTATQLSNE